MSRDGDQFVNGALLSRAVTQTDANSVPLATVPLSNGTSALATSQVDTDGNPSQVQVGQKTAAASLPVVLASDQPAVPTSRAVTPGAATAQRAGVAAADVVAAPGTVTCTKLTGVGSATAGTYTVFAVAGNTYGRTTATQGNTTVTTETTNLGVRAAFAQVTGAMFYDLYMSTDGAAAKFVGRVTETQRASGIIINGVNTTTAGGTTNAVDIYVAGTGLAVNGGQVAQNTAYTPEGLTGITPSGAENLDINVTFSRTGDSVAGSLVLIPFYLGSGGHYWAGDPVTLTFGGTTSSYPPLRQTFRAPCRGRTTVVVVASIAGTGASVDLESVAS